MLFPIVFRGEAKPSAMCVAELGPKGCLPIVLQNFNVWGFFLNLFNFMYYIPIFIR